MYKELRDKELENFVNKYFKAWGKDIRKVTLLYNAGLYEYLINDYLLFKVDKKVRN